MPSDIRVVYLDWSGTIARPGTKSLFLGGDTQCLYDDVRPSINMLQDAGFRVGLILNTSASHCLFLKALERSGLQFTAAVISAGGPDGGMPWRKPDPRIYNKALDMDHISPKEAVMIGDHAENDVAGAQRVGLRAIHLQRSSSSESNGPVSVQVPVCATFKDSESCTSLLHAAMRIIDRR